MVIAVVVIVHLAGTGQENLSSLHSLLDGTRKKEKCPLGRPQEVSINGRTIYAAVSSLFEDG